MIELKDLVPPLELCKMIPAGHFADSALVWAHNGGMVVERTPDAVTLGRPPAPTLAEILEADHRITLSRSHNGRLWVAEAWIDGVWTARNAINPATAALRLWLDVNGMEVEK